MGAKNIVGSNNESEKSELEETIEMKPDEIKADYMKTFDYFDMKISAMIPNKPSSPYEQPSPDLNKWPIIKSSNKYSHASQFTKHLSSMNLSGDTLLQLPKWWYAIHSSFCQYL